MTKVDECTSADTGVGAAIAAGSHLENGICALFVIAAKVIIAIWRILFIFSVLIWIIFQWPWDRVHPIDRRMATSPIRFVIAVTSPALSDLEFW